MDTRSIGSDPSSEFSLQPNARFHTLFKVQKHLGRGAYGSTCVVVLKADEKCRLAAKIIDLHGETEEDKRKVMRETSILSRLKHPNIIKFYGSIHEHSEEKLYLILEFVEKGDLSVILEKRKKSKLKFPEDIVLTWTHQLLSALAYLHSQKVIHRDLKPSNILVANDFSLKLCDFGVSFQQSSSVDFANTMIGTPYYLSPEICNREDYSAKTDIWSLGCMVYELCTQQVIH